MTWKFGIGLYSNAPDVMAETGLSILWYYYSAFDSVARDFCYFLSPLQFCLKFADLLPFCTSRSKRVLVVLRSALHSLELAEDRSRCLWNFQRNFVTFIGAHIFASNYRIFCHNLRFFDIFDAWGVLCNVGPVSITLTYCVTLNHVVFFIGFHLEFFPKRCEANKEKMETSTFTSMSGV